MLQTTMQRIVTSALALFAFVAVAQETPAIPTSGEQERVIIVPSTPLEAYDAGVYEPPPPQPQAEPQVPVPDAPYQPETRTFQATPPEPPPPEQLDKPVELPTSGPGAMIDGHPREGAFLSGPGSAIFLTHHTLMGGLGALATQLIPRAIHASPIHEVPGQPGVMAGCDPTAGTLPEPYQGFPDAERPTSCSDIVTGSNARLMYLTSGLLGAGIGFASAAIWQFNNWISVRSANFGIINSAFGSMFLGALGDLATRHNDAYATAWLSLIGGAAGAWLSAILTRNDYPLNKMALVTSGGAWAAIYGALITAIIATSGGGVTLREGLDAVMLMPAIGAGLMALAALKFNPSFGQVMRANLFGGLVGGVVLLVSGLLLGPTTGFTRSPVPYILGGVGAIGAQTLVSLLWADAAETSNVGYDSNGKYRMVWW
ncbi:MAG: hypothetical protein DI536_05760 [Archangium gephyra]|uniref:Uncharacterized protein n=1 Tax=Archangium gephyra TaxID=48 RepID=A0A2W5W0P9_9BACT|nr:MAG: hypothetical protein DI536_05760 [Archangium gephyra]